MSLSLASKISNLSASLVAGRLMMSSISASLTCCPGMAVIGLASANEETTVEEDPGGPPAVPPTPGVLRFNGSL